jgi:hypothetical protein
MLRKAGEMKADQGDTPDVIVQGALTLASENDLLLKGFKDLVEARNRLYSPFYDSGFNSFFSW